MGSGASLISTIESIGYVTNNRQIYEIIPKIIRNTTSLPGFQDILFSNVDLVMVILSLFITLRILIPGSMKFGGVQFWLLISTFLITPTITSIILRSVRMGIPDGKGEEGIIMPAITLATISGAIVFLLYIAWPLTSITGFEVSVMYVILWLFVFVPLILGITVISKSIAPILVLLLGPGIIPHLANQSFFEFCS
jgi:hypothetical protein